MSVLPLVLYTGKGEEVLMGTPMMMIGLNLNVIRPTGTATNAKLPVVVWIYGGGFAFGSNAVYVSGLFGKIWKQAYEFSR